MPCAFHLTPACNVEAIRREGLRPSIGPRSQAAAEPQARVWAFPGSIEKATLEDAIVNWVAEAFDDVGQPLALIEFEYEDGDADAALSAGEIAISHPIPPEKIRVRLLDIEIGFNELDIQHFAARGPE